MLDFGQFQWAESCANPAKIQSNRQSLTEAHAAAQAKVNRLQAAISALGDVDMIEKENLERALRAVTSRGASRVGADHFYEGVHRWEKKRLVAAEEAVIAVVQNRGRVSRSFSTGRETFGRIAVETSNLSWFALEFKWQSFKEELGRSSVRRHSSGCHSWVSCRTLSLDGGPSEGLAGSPQQGRPESGCDIKPDVHEGSRAHGRDDSSGHLRRRISVSCGPREGRFATMLVTSAREYGGTICRFTTDQVGHSVAFFR